MQFVDVFGIYVTLIALLECVQKTPTSSNRPNVDHMTFTTHVPKSLKAAEMNFGPWPYSSIVHFLLSCKDIGDNLKLKREIDCSH